MKSRLRRFFFGVSVSPYRKDWESELEYVVTQIDAVLLKLIPSAQHIYLMDTKHTDFYRALTVRRICEIRKGRILR